MTRQSSQQQEQQGIVLKRKRTSSFVSHTTRDAASLPLSVPAAAASSLTLFRKPCQVKKHCLYWLLLVCTLHSTSAFLTQLSTSTQVGLPSPHVPLPSSSSSSSRSSSRSSSSSWALRVTWFGGTAETEVSNNNNDDSCELVAVRIERTSANSRRILGEIVVEAPLSHVWSILTDYNRLSVHVPNLVESRIVSVHTPDRQPGDGHYRCRLFQKGAQKIVGFEFGASVTMDMAERVNGEMSALYNNNSDDSNADEVTTPVSRSIQFKCYDSFFFSEFDGQWKATEQVNPASGQIETVLSYTVDVRPKGPVPVAALEWRIREDVPTNLRAVKSAALLRQQQKLRRTASAAAAGRGDTAATTPQEQGESLTAYTEKSPVLDATTRRRRSGVANNERDGTALTPRQRQEQLQASAAAARRVLRRPAISSFAKAATPPPRKRQEHKTTASQQEQQQQQQPHRRMTKIKVDWDDNETLGAYLKGP